MLTFIILILINLLYLHYVVFIYEVNKDLNMEKWFIYLYNGEDNNGKFTEKHYYMNPVDNDNLTLIGTCEVNKSYFCATNSKFYDNDKMYTRREILNESKSCEDGSNIKGMLEDYNRLKYSYIPQLLKHFSPDGGGYFTPHLSKLKQ